LQSIPHLVIVAVAFSIVLGVPFGLYAVLTRAQRRTTCQIRAAAFEHGWKYSPQRLQGDPTAFRIKGHTAGGLAWIMISEQSGGHDLGWSVRLRLRFPMLGGKKDFEIEQRPPRSHGPTSLTPAAPQHMQDRVAALSDVVAAEIGFRQRASEIPTGVPAFDGAYRILALPRMLESPVDPALARRIFDWPADTVQPHSMLCWRDPYGLHLQVRLPGSPNWETVSYLLVIAEDLVRRLPPPVISPLSRSLIDRIFAPFMKS
jgi:hypothetical protein